MKDFLGSIKQIRKKVIKTGASFSFLLPSLLFLLLFCILFFLERYLLFDIEKNVVVPQPINNYKMVSYPVLQSVLGTSALEPFQSSIATDIFNLPISAQAAVVIDKDSKVVLYAKTPHLRFSTASTAKIMTSLVALDYYKLNDILTIYTDEVEGAKVGFRVGETFYFKDLLYATMLPSGNDAALSIAQNYKGGELLFVAKMNQKAKELYLLNTHYSDAMGLDDENDYTTAIDLARLSVHAMDNEILARVVSTRQTDFWNVSKTKQYSVANLNQLLGFDGVNGIKTGFTQGAGEVLVTSKVENGHTIIIVVMKSENRFQDTQILLSYISGRISYINY